MYRGRRRAHRGCDLLISHAAEIMQFDDLSEARLELQQALQSVIQSDHVDVDRQRYLREIDARVLAHAGVALYARARLRMVHQDAPHEPRGEGEKMLTILQL